MSQMKHVSDTINELNKTASTAALKNLLGTRTKTKRGKSVCGPHYKQYLYF